MEIQQIRIRNGWLLQSFNVEKFTNKNLVSYNLVICWGITIGTILSIFIFSYSWIINQYILISTQLQVHEYYTNTNNIMNVQIASARSIIIRGQKQIVKGNILYQFLQKRNEFTIESPFDCLTNIYAGPSEFQSLFCYGIFGEYTQHTPIDLSLNLSSLLTQVVLMIDQDLDLLFATSGNEQYYSIWPGDPYRNYYPHNREWYKQHILKASSGEITYFSDPYLTYPWLLYMITMTTNMTNINGNLDGLFGSDFNLSLIKTFQQQYDNLYFSIIDRQGILLMSHSEILGRQYIYNQSLTGLTYESFQEILNLANGLNFTSNCDSFYLDKLCRHNELFDRDEMIQAQYLIRPDVIIVIQTNLEYKRKDLANQNTKFQTDFTNQTNFSLILSLTICISSIIINSIIIYYLSDPIYSILKFAYQIIHQDTLSCVKYLNFRVQALISTTSMNDDCKKLMKAFNKIRTEFRYGQKKQKKIKNGLQRIRYPKHELMEKITIKNSNIIDKYPYDNFISRTTIFQLQKNINIIRDKERQYYNSVK